MNKSVSSMLYHTFVIVFGFIMLYPIFWLIISSLKEESKIFTETANLIITSFEVENYVKGWEGVGNQGFDVFFKNSLLVTSVVVIGTLLSSSLVAFGFARIEFKFRGILFACLLATVMLPMQVTLIPQYILFNNIGWVNTFLPLMVPAFLGGIPFFIFLMVQFIRGIPKELDEAAVMDGCGYFGIFWKVILPLCKPSLVTVAIFSFMWTWDDFFAQLIYLNEPRLFTVPLGLNMFSDPDTSTEWGPLLAMSSLSLLPQIILFTFCQKYLVDGMATTGLK